MVCDKETPVACPPREARLRLPAASLLTPSADLSPCVRAYVSRDTRDTPMAPLRQSSHFPATATCALIWVLEGRLDSVCAVGGRPGEPLPPGVLFRGPQSRPFVASGAGPLRLFMCFLMPDALHALAGLKPAAWTNRTAAMCEALGGEWQAMARRVQHASDDAGRVECIENFLRPRWRVLRGAGHLSAERYEDWASCLRSRAQASGAGQSERQMERRIKGISGLSWRDIRAINQAEAVFVKTGEAAVWGPLVWAEVASDAGYADQPHLCRSIRKASGFTPTELHSRTRFDEAFWIYRLSRLWR